MSESYYLINEKIKFYFEIENLRIEFDGQHESLEPKEARILKYVLENHVDGVINSEVILNANWDYWNDKKVLQKVLSTLRKKFKKIGVTENGFVAADADYKINYIAVLVNDLQRTNEQKKQTQEKILRYAKTVVPSVIAAIVVLVVISFADFKDGANFSVGNIIQSTTISGASIEPDLSPDGTAMAFSHKKQGTSQIYLKLDTNLNFQVLTEGHYDQVPSWSPSGQQLAFQRWENGTCEVRLLQLDANYNKVGDDELLATCSHYSNLMSITWKDEKTLYFTESTSSFGAGEIRQLDLPTKTVTTYFSYAKSELGTSSYGSGHYFIVYNKELKALFSLQSPDWKISNISRVNDDNTTTFLHAVSITLLSFDIFDKQVIFKDIDNQLKTFPLDDPKNLSTIYKNPLKSISYPVVSDNSNKIAIVSGSVYKNSIHALDLKTNKVSEIMASENLVKYPKNVQEDILFMSGETGIFQIYTFSNNVKTQITNFNKNKNIVYFTLSKNKKWLAISFSDSTSIYERHEGSLIEVKSFPLKSYPDFSKNSDRILISNWVSTGGDTAQGMDKSLVEYYLDGFKETGISIPDAEYGIYHDSGIIFPTKDKQIKLFKLNGIDTIVESLKVSSRSSIAVNNNSLFVSHSVDKVVKIDLQTRQRSELAEPILGQITVNDHYMYFKKRESGSMVIFKGELTEN